MRKKLILYFKRRNHARKQWVSLELNIPVSLLGCSPWQMTSVKMGQLLLEWVAILGCIKETEHDLLEGWAMNWISVSIPTLAFHDHKHRIIQGKWLSCCDIRASACNHSVTTSRTHRHPADSWVRSGSHWIDVRSGTAVLRVCCVLRHPSTPTWLDFWSRVQCSSSEQLELLDWQYPAVIEEFMHDCVI